MVTVLAAVNTSLRLLAVVLEYYYRTLVPGDLAGALTQLSHDDSRLIRSISVAGTYESFTSASFRQKINSVDEGVAVTFHFLQLK